MTTIRAETAADRAAIHEVNALAFGREAEAGLVDAIRDSPEFIPELSLVAEWDGRVAGHVLFSRIVIRTADSDVPALTLAPVAVRPEAQNQGVGTALVREGLERARALGHRIVVVIGHPTYYPRFGFAPARPQGLEAPFPIADPPFMALALVPGALDGVRGTVVYPPAFEGV
ncbi:MAG TPA: N-acetyltransferase [Thermomicrobiaceae bacterium]|nr:N-acetyltransferase [Thermomicrobiaceae bacterium]